MKNRKFEFQVQGAQSNLPKEPKKVLFVCDGEQVDSRVAEILFEAEGHKMDVFWTPSSRRITSGLPLNSNSAISSSTLAALKVLGIEDGERLSQPLSEVTIDDLQKVDLIVYLQSVDANVLQKAFPSFKGEVDVWKIPSSSETFDVLLQNVKSLLVRLILKGGKRPPNVVQEMVSKPNQPQVNSKSAIRVRLESKGRGGKKVTVVSGLPMGETELEKLSTELKQSCGTGGTVKDGCIEIQGDQCDRILAELKRRGMQAKRSGG